MMRLFLTVAVVLFIMPAVVMAEEPVVKVDCLCVAEIQGWVLGRSNATPSQLGIDKLKPGIAIVVLSAAENQCGKYPSGCTDERYKPIAGQVRTTLENYGYLAVEDDFKLTIEGNKATK